MKSLMQPIFAAHSIQLDTSSNAAALFMLEVLQDSAVSLHADCNFQQDRGQQNDSQLQQQH